MIDLIPRMDAIQACNVGPSDEWSKSTKSGYEQAATDCQRNIMRIKPAALEPQPDPRDEVIARLVKAVHNCVGMLDQLVAESGRLVEWGAEDPFRMGEWFEPEDLAQIESARAALEPQPISKSADLHDPRDEVIARLVEALGISANRLDRCAVDYETGSRKFIVTSEWADEARAAIVAAKAVQK